MLYVCYIILNVVLVYNVQCKYTHKISLTQTLHEVPNCLDGYTTSNFAPAKLRQLCEVLVQKFTHGI